MKLDIEIIVFSNLSPGARRITTTPDVRRLLENKVTFLKFLGADRSLFSKRLPQFPPVRSFHFQTEHIKIEIYIQYRDQTYLSIQSVHS